MLLKKVCLGLALVAVLAAAGCCNPCRRSTSSSACCPAPCCPSPCAASPCCDGAPTQAFSAPMSPGCCGR
jgi:hypothetical protein